MITLTVYGTALDVRCTDDRLTSSVAELIADEVRDARRLDEADGERQEDGVLMSDKSRRLVLTCCNLSSIASATVTVTR